MGISFRLAGCVWCETCTGVQSLRQHVREALLFHPLSVLHTNMHPPSHTHTHTLASHSLRCQSLPRGSPQSAAVLKRQREGSLNTHNMFLGLVPVWLSFTSFLLFLSLLCSWGMALRHGTLAMLAIMLMESH